MAAEAMLTTREAAARLKVHPITVRRYCRAQKLAHVRLPSGEIRLAPAVVDAFLDAHTVDAVAEPVAEPDPTHVLERYPFLKPRR